MTAIGRGQASSATNPALDVFLLSNNGAVDPAALSNTPIDPTALAWEIFDVSTPATFAAPVSVATGTISDFSTTAPSLGASRLSAGHYFASWTPPGTEPLGRHRIAWSWTVPTDAKPGTSTTVDGAWSEDFEVTGFAVLPMAQGYCLISDLRDEGVTNADSNDARVQRLIGLQSRYIERITGRFFEARFGTKRFDGTGGRILPFTEPIIAVSSVHIATSPLFPSDLEIDADFFRVFNRHLTQGLTMPDDRNNPRIELFHSSEDLAGIRPFTFSRLIWPRGQQNVLISGLWGYTDPDGSPAGGTPELIRHACKLLTFRELPKLCADKDKREDAQKRYRLLGEGTRDQHYNMEPNKLFGAFTGDSEIDSILASFMRPPMIGGV